MLEQAVRIPSVSGQEQAVAQFLVDAMAQLGFHSYVDEAGNAVGEAGEGPTVVLLGHIDTVPGEVTVRVEDGKLYGRGTVDAKGPFVNFIAAAARLIQRGELRQRLVLVGAVEEEAASSRGAHYVVDRYAPSACIIGEPSGWERLTLGYKGRLLIEGRWEQPMAHSAGKDIAVAERAVAFWNAVHAYCDAANQGKARLFDQLIPSLRSIHSGSDGLQDWAELAIGLRLPPGITPSVLAQELSGLAGDEPGRTQDEPGRTQDEPGRTQDSPLLQFRGGCEAYQGEKNTPLVRAFLKGVRSVGGAPGFLLKTGTSDMNVVGPAWRCPILAYGPGDSSLDHTPEEHVEIAEFERAVDVLEAALRYMQP